MLEMLMQWYRRRFSDPEAIALLIILVAGFSILFFFSGLLAPVLFSEAVNLHPLAIILSVIIFGGLWGLWGVFFAIPLATLIKAVIHMWPDTVVVEDQ